MKRLRPITTESTGLRRCPREDTGEFCRRLLIAALLALGVAGAAAAAEKKIQKATYEAQVEKNGKRSEMAVDALGKRVTP